MNHKELIAETASKAGVTQTDAKKVVDALVEVIKETVKTGDKVRVHEFGTFDKGHRKERQGINPATKQAITIGAKDFAKFKATDKFLY